MEMQDDALKDAQLSWQRIVSMLVSVPMFIFFIFPGLVVLKSLVALKITLFALVILHGVCGVLWFKKDLPAGGMSLVGVVIYASLYNVIF